MHFKDEGHANTFNDLLTKARAGSDHEYTSALYVLAATGKSVDKYVKPREIDFPELMDDSQLWSSGEKALIRLAASLFNGSVWSVSLYEVFRSLDGANTIVTLEALKIRYGPKEVVA